MASRGTGLHRLTAREIGAADGGDHMDGGGLLLRVRGESANWVLRYTSPTGRRREMGLGTVDRSSVAAAGKSAVSARDLAHKARELLRQGIDPIEAREQQRGAAKAAEAAQKADRAREHWTLARWAREYHQRVIEPSRTPKHAAQWLASLENHVAPELWHAPIDTIEPPPCWPHCWT